MISRQELVPLIGKRADITHGGGVNADLYIFEVGENHLFGRRPHSPDPIIPIKEITRVSWNDTVRRELVATPRTED